MKIEIGFCSGNKVVLDVPEGTTMTQFYSEHLKGKNWTTSATMMTTFDDFAIRLDRIEYLSVLK